MKGEWVTEQSSQGLRCYPHPGSELPLQALVLGEGTCEKRRDAEYGASPEQVAESNHKRNTTQQRSFHWGAPIAPPVLHSSSIAPSHPVVLQGGIVVSELNSDKLNISLSRFCMLQRPGREPVVSLIRRQVALVTLTLDSGNEVGHVTVVLSSSSRWGSRGTPYLLIPLLDKKENGDDHSEGSLVENHVDGNINLLGGGGGAGRKPLKSGMKELAVFREKVTEQHRQMGKGGKHHLGLEEPKKLRPPPARV
ncbi:hypothetical protein CB1_000931022 [Camelus ferus]|nr:hypothetical protein CB1_000931022 [Camelus ferus]